MSFLESPRFPDRLATGVEGGPSFLTTIAKVQSGKRTTLANWEYPLRTWSVQHIPVNDRTAFNALRDFFMAMRGQAHSFRVRDPFDYQDEGVGFLESGTGNGLPALQLTKRYGLPGWYSYRPIRKPAAATIKRNGVAVVAGSGAGQVAIDLTTGKATFVADASANVSTVTPGASTVVQLASAVGVATGGALYVAGLGGSLGAALNGRAWAVTGVSGGTYTLAVNTTGLSGATAGASGAKYPQPSDVLTWEGSFDTPAHFTTDEFRPVMEGGGVITFPDLAIEEERNP